MGVAIQAAYEQQRLSQLGKYCESITWQHVVQIKHIGASHCTLTDLQAGSLRLPRVGNLRTSKRHR